MQIAITNISTEILNFAKAIFPDIENETTECTKVVVPKEQAWSTYKIRYTLKVEQQSITHISKQLYENTLAKLNDFAGENVSIYLFNHTNKKMVIVFSDITDREIIGHLLL